MRRKTARAGHALLVSAPALAIAVTMGAVSAFAGGPPRIDPEAPRLLLAGPLVGYAGATGAAIWAAPAKAEDELELAWAREDGSDAERRARMPTTADGFAATVRLDGLSPSTRYRYRVLVGGKSDEGTSGSFRTGPAPGKPCRGTIGVVSCMNVSRHPSQVAWKALLAERPDLLVHLGDSVYANSPSRKTLRPWHVAQRRVPEYALAIRTTPCLAVWDDHDFGPNNSDGTLEGKDESLATFRELWPNPGCGLPNVPGVFFEASFGDVDLFLLDARYHRSPDFAKDDETKHMLGDDQFRWLEERLRRSRARFKVVASSSTLMASRLDGWRLYTRDRLRLFALTRSIEGMVAITGDVHWSAIQRHETADTGYSLPELISSGIAVNAVTPEGKAAHSFGTIEVDTTAKDPTLTLRVRRVGNDGAPRGGEDRAVALSELTPVY